MSLNAFYSRLPVIAQNLACSLQGWRIQRTRYGSGFWEILPEVEQRLTWSSEKLTAFRDERLRNFVRHCATTVPYYQRLFADMGIDPARIRTLDDLSQLPILTKTTVQSRTTEFFSNDIAPARRVFMGTSGTTGTGLRIATTSEAIYELWAVWWRYRRIHHIPFDAWSAHFSGKPVVPIAQTTPPYWRYNFPGRQILFSAYHISSSTLHWYIDTLNRRQPKWFHGYPSLLALLAAYVIEHNMTLDYKPSWITTGAENLLPQQASLIETAFGVRPIQHYGLTEAVANISQCSRGRLHIDEDFAAVELVPLPDRSGYSIVGTNLSNLATPLLRYDTGDVVELTDEVCDCGNPGRIVCRIDGRQEDYVVLRNGRKIGRMYHIFADMTAVREAQIYQRYPGAIEVRVVPNSWYGSDDEHILLQRLREVLGADATVRIIYVEQIPRPARGKLRFVVSEIEEGRLVNL